MKQQIPSGASSRLLINLGCGPFVQETQWQDYDGSWNVLASHLPLGLGWLARRLIGQRNSGFPGHVKYLNVTKRLPFTDSSVDAVYYSHMLEHLYLDEGRHLLRESYRILKPGGILRVLVPDTEHYVNNYLAEKAAGKTDACLALNESLMFRPLTNTKGFLRRLYTAATDFHSHKFMYDRAFLRQSMMAVGFSQVEEMRYLASRIPEVAAVESEDRIGRGLGFGVEAVRG